MATLTTDICEPESPRSSPVIDSTGSNTKVRAVLTKTQRHYTKTLPQDHHFTRKGNLEDRATHPKVPQDEVEIHRPFVPLLCKAPGRPGYIPEGDLVKTSTSVPNSPVPVLGSGPHTGHTRPAQNEGALRYYPGWARYKSIPLRPSETESELSS